jgi:hypothetical protein
MIRLHLIANALLLWLAYYWLGVGESSVPRLLWSALLAAAILCGALVLYGAACTWQEPLPAALRRALRHLLPLVALALLALFIYALLAWWKTYSSGPAFKIASWLTLKMRRPVRPEAVLGAFNSGLWILRWVVLPWILVPLAAALATGGWAAVSKRIWRRPGLYWLAVPLLLLIALGLPRVLLGWSPLFDSFGLEMASFIARALGAYIFFVAGLLGLAWATSAGNPRFSHPSTVPSP